MMNTARFVVRVLRRVRDRLRVWMDSKSMETEVVCQHCSKKMKRHCKHCLWLECVPCEMVIGTTNVVYYGEARKRNEEALKRQNGI